VTNLNGVPVAHAEVIIEGTPYRAATNDSGVYRIEIAPVGRVHVIVRRVGFEPADERAILKAGAGLQLDFELKGLPELLDSVMVREAGGNGRMADFWARRLIGVGAFITRDDIDRRHPSRSSDLLRMVTGVRVVAGESGFDRPLITMGRNSVTANRLSRNNTPVLGSDCRVAYYVDGSFVPSGTFHMDDISPLMLEAVEIYRGPAETPARLRQRDTACGLIMIWTREPPPRQPPISW
ncbi:MAG: carboxypeptidase regulatory-like domain-containing protein, partial [Gemmatimonadota bacterium]|nr:carboxypeptidase regulatory-like domain-containing protein [Gemmatimonadota bacterium]